MLIITQAQLDEIHRQLEKAYPEEGVGFLFGVDDSDAKERVVKALHAVPNAWQPETERRRRYDVAPQEIMDADEKADAMGLVIIGAYHSHPDHPAKPSEFDRERAHPFFSYLITSLRGGKSISTRSWRLLEDRSEFVEEEIKII